MTARRLSEATGSEAIRSRYEQAGLMIGYLRARDPGGRRFLRLITSIGSIDPGRPDQVDASLRRLYDTDFERFEQNWFGPCPESRLTIYWINFLVTSLALSTPSLEWRWRVPLAESGM